MRHVLGLFSCMVSLLGVGGDALPCMFCGVGAKADLHAPLGGVVPNLAQHAHR
jgi:hypothetical protein